MSAPEFNLPPLPYYLKPKFMARQQGVHAYDQGHRNINWFQFLAYYLQNRFIVGANRLARREKKAIALFSFALFGIFGDIATTAYGIHYAGAVEANPVANALFLEFGMGVSMAAVALVLLLMAITLLGKVPVRGLNAMLTFSLASVFIFKFFVVLHNTNVVFF